jgi:hypothetical protein
LKRVHLAAPLSTPRDIGPHCDSHTGGRAAMTRRDEAARIDNLTIERGTWRCAWSPEGIDALGGG